VCNSYVKTVQLTERYETCPKCLQARCLCCYEKCPCVKPTHYRFVNWDKHPHVENVD